MPAARGGADLELLCAKVGFWLGELRLTNEQGEPTRPVGEFRQLKPAELAYERKPGMTPASRQAPKANNKTMFDVAAVFAAVDVSPTVTGRVLEAAKSGGRMVDQNDDVEVVVTTAEARKKPTSQTDRKSFLEHR
jgi:hypothetical protein